jgi:hypothetical protein
MAPHHSEQEAHYPGVLTAITPVRRLWPFWLRGFWWLLRCIARLNVVPKGVLMDTSMINSARWSLLDRVPAKGRGSKPHALGRPYLLFEANFSGDLSGYLETFSFVDAVGVWLMWRGSYEFPPPQQARRFFEFVNDRRLNVDCSYSAYPEATTSMIRAAIALERHILKFDEVHGQLLADDFAGRYREWLPTVQTIRDPEGEAGTACSFTAIAVIEPERLEQLKEKIGGLAPSDLAIGDAQKAIPEKTHFARLTIANQFLQSFLKREERDAKGDPTSYLMFSTWFDAAGPEQQRPQGLQSHLRGLHSRFGGEAEAIWSACRGFSAGRGPDYLCRYLLEHEVDAGLPFATYPGKTVHEVKSALALAGRFSEFTRDAQGCTANRLVVGWRRMVDERMVAT